MLSGCWKGHSAYIISKLINESGKKINFHIFDSFEGLSEATTKDESFYLKDSKEKIIYKYFASSENIVKDVLKDFTYKNLQGLDTKSFWGNKR